MDSNVWTYFVNGILIILSLILIQMTHTAMKGSSTAIWIGWFFRKKDAIE
jgi:hypothetical protein